MSDETPPDTGVPAEGQRPAASRRPAATPGASAASRARRIGGARPSAAGRPGSSRDAAVEPTDAPTGVPTGVPTVAPSVAREAGSPAVVTQAPQWLTWVPAAVLAGCAVVMAVLVAVAGHGVWYDKPSSSALRDRVLAAAKTCIAAANTYTYRTIPQDEAKGLACSTGQWSGQYRKAMATLVKPIATKLKASQAIQINDAGIENISPSGRQWTVVVYGQTKITQAGKPGRTDPFSASVTMQHVNGKWLIAQINTIAKPAG